MASKSKTIYIGFTTDLMSRVHEHKNGWLEKFTRKYKCHRLVYEEAGGIEDARLRETQIKKWRRKKTALIEKENPAWEDLSLNVFGS